MIANWTFPYLKEAKWSQMKGNRLINWACFSWQVLSLCAKFSFQTRGGKPPIFMKLGPARGILLFFLKHMATIKQCVGNSHHQFNFQKDNGLKTTQVIFFFLAWIQRFILISASPHPHSITGMTKLAASFIQMYFTSVGSTCFAG